MTTGIRVFHRRNAPSKRRHPARGFSLIEVLVVLVVLLIGILSVLRLFPGGFLTIQRTGELTIGQSLAGQQLDQQKNTESIFESVVALLPDANGAPDTKSVDTSVLPDDLRDLTFDDLQALVPNVALTNKADPYYFSNINRIRHIIGENFRIPIPTSNAGKVFGAVYMVQNGPVYNAFGTDPNDPNQATDSIAVRGAALQRTEQSSVPTLDTPDPTPILQNPSQYAIDYQNLQIAFYPRIGTGKRRFTISYNYYVANGNLVSVRSALNDPTTTILTVNDIPANAAPNGQALPPIWQPIFKTGAAANDTRAAALPQNFTGLVRNSEDVSRAFRLVNSTPVNDYPVNGTPNAPVWSDDPYEYAWYSEQDGGYANVGVLIFNPRGHNEIEQTTSGPRPLSARVDYTSCDNHIIHEDRSMPTKPPYTVKLSLPFILTQGDILADQTAYNGIFRDSKATPDVLVYNVNTGEELGQIAGGVTDALSIPFTVNSQVGSVRFDDAAVANKGLQSATLRFFYRTQKDWGMQVQKAQARYTKADTPATVDYKSFYVGGSANNVGGLHRLYFPPSEAGKTVVLGEYYAVTNKMDSQNKPIIKRFTNEAYQINDNRALFETFNGVTLTFIDLISQHAEADTDAWQWTSDPTGLAVSNVQGSSLKSRVIWRSGDRWRKVDTDTFLLQAQTR